MYTIGKLEVLVVDWTSGARFEDYEEYDLPDMSKSNSIYTGDYTKFVFFGSDGNFYSVNADVVRLSEEKNLYNLNDTGFAGIQNVFSDDVNISLLKTNGDIVKNFNVQSVDKLKEDDTDLIESYLQSPGQEICVLKRNNGSRKVQISWVYDITVGLDYCIYACIDGKVFGIGNNQYGQLGTGDNLTATTFVECKELEK